MPVLTPAVCSKQMQQPPGRFGRQWWHAVDGNVRTRQICTDPFKPQNVWVLWLVLSACTEAVYPLFYSIGSRHNFAIVIPFDVCSETMRYSATQKKIVTFAMF